MPKKKSEKSTNTIKVELPAPEIKSPLIFISGIQRMIEACKKAGLPAPLFREHQGGFQVTFLKTSYRYSMGNPETNQFKLNEFTNKYSSSSKEITLNNRQRKILEYLLKKGEVTLAEARKITKNVSRQTIHRDFQGLIKKRFVKEIGETRGRKYVLIIKK